ncbi:MAG: hypothetical protein QM627_04805 [Luteolibacter sp.]
MIDSPDPQGLDGWVKILLPIFLALVLPLAAQELTNEQLVQYLPAGKELAKQAWLAKSGNLQISKYHKVRYTQGPAAGMTKEQALAKFEEIWSSTSGSVRKEWALKAMKSGPPTVEEEKEEAATAPVETEKPSPPKDIIVRDGKVYSVMGGPSSGWKIRDGKLYPANGGAPTHIRAGSVWRPINPQTHYPIEVK